MTPTMISVVLRKGFILNANVRDDLPLAAARVAGKEGQ